MPTLKTTIKLRYDTFTNWTLNNPILAAGEVAVVALPSDAGENIEQAKKPAVLFKVGDGSSNFSVLPWASALAADVYDWAKASTKPTYTATEVGAAESVHTHVKADITDFPTKLSDFENDLPTVTNTNTTYQIVSTGKNAFKLQSKELDGDWQDVAGSTFTVDFAEVNAAIEAAQNAAQAAQADVDALEEKVTTLEGTVANKADKATTLTGYGIKDAYTKSEVDSAMSTLKRNAYQVVEELPVSGEEGITYLVLEDGTETTYRQYIWEGSAYIDLGTTDIDLSNYVTKETFQPVANKAHEHSNKTELDLIQSGDKAKWDAKYDKPAEGIPETDLAQEVKDKLNKEIPQILDITSYITPTSKNTGNISEEGYNTVVDYITNKGQSTLKIVLSDRETLYYVELSETSQYSALILFNSSSVITVNKQNYSYTIYSTTPILMDSTTNDNYFSITDVLGDLRVDAYNVNYIDNNFQTKLSSSNKLSADLIQDGTTNKVFTSTDKENLDKKYEKPSTGIPKTDLAQEVKDSLAKADSALQEVANGSITNAKLDSDLQGKVAQAHEHSNKAILDATTASFTTELKTKVDGIDDALAEKADKVHTHKVADITDLEEVIFVLDGGTSAGY